MNTYCIQYKESFHTNTAFLFAISAQAAVDCFRTKHTEQIIAVFILNKTEDWK